MNKYFFTAPIIDGEVILTGETAHHLVNVMRISPGDTLTLCDGKCTDYIIEVTGVQKQAVTCKIAQEIPCHNEPTTKITLYQAMPKGEKLEMIIQKCVELGVTKIVPIITSRSIVRKMDEKKTARFQRIAESAACQSMRGMIPRVDTAIPFLDALGKLPPESLNLVAYEGENKLGLKSLLMQNMGAKSLNIFIGPEGGWAKEEITILQGAGVTPITLGKTILRTETAAIATVAQALFFMED